MIRRLLVLSCAAVVLGSCIFTPSTRNAGSLLRSTAGNLNDIKSGELFMRLETGVKDGKLSGFELKGPFSLESSGDLPVARLEDTHFEGDRKETATFVSTGSRAFAVVKNKTYALSKDKVGGLSAFVRRPGSSGESSAQLDVGKWMKGDRRVSAGGLVGGVDTDQVTTGLDTGAVLRGLVQLARAFGAGRAAQLPTLSQGDVEPVREATKAATMSVWTGKKDRILRKLVMEAELAAGKDLSERIKALAGIRIRLETTITKVNEPVKVEAPSGPIQPAG